MSAYYATRSFDHEMPLTEAFKLTGNEGEGGSSPKSAEGNSRGAQRGAGLSSRQEALRLWKRKSLTRMIEGKGADVEFSHEALTTDEVLEIRAQLRELQDQGAVRGFFEGLG